jgi:hypothetical protein
MVQAIKHKIFTEEESMDVIYVYITQNASMMVHKLLEFHRRIKMMNIPAISKYRKQRGNK